MSNKPQKTVTTEQFLKDYHAFREMMGNRNNSVETLNDAFRALMFVWMAATVTYRHPDTTDEQVDMMDSAFRALQIEWSMRSAHMIVRPLREAVKDTANAAREFLGLPAK